MKKYLLIGLFGCVLLSGCPSTSSLTSVTSESLESLSSISYYLPYPASYSTNELPAHLENEAYHSFRFFWDTPPQNLQSPGYGLVPDRMPSNPGLSSIASVGFGLSAIVIGVENNWISEDQGRERLAGTLNTLENLAHVNGFFYHFYYNYGVPAPSEISSIDSALLFMGLLHAGSYFGGEEESRARALYERANWAWFVNPSRNMFYMAYNASKKEFGGAWDFYAEQLMMYFLGVASPTYPISPELFYTFIRHYGIYGGYAFIHSWFGSLFTYQFSHAWIDFRYMKDRLGVNWFQNSVNATLANHQYAVDNPQNFKTFSSLAWGMTASDSPKGYNGYFGAPPSGYSNDAHKNDGTIAPAGALGSIVFAPELAIASSAYFTEVLGTQLIGDYGYKDAFNLEGETPWFNGDVIGIDKGITLLMIENYRNELVWRHMWNLDIIQTAIEALQFQGV